MRKIGIVCLMMSLASMMGTARAAEDWNLRLSTVGLQSNGTASFGMLGFTTALVNAPAACTNSRSSPIALFPVVTEQDRALLSLATSAYLAHKSVKAFYSGACLMGYAVISRLDMAD